MLNECGLHYTPKTYTDSLKKKILYNSSHRGLRELEIILKKFNDKFLNNLNQKDLNRLNKMLDLNDLDFYNRIIQESRTSKKNKPLYLLSKIFFGNKNSKLEK